MSQKYGLTTQEAEASRAQYGRNELSRPPKETFWQKFAANLKDPMIRILTAALVINIIFVYTGHGDWLETVGIFLAILRNMPTKTPFRNSRKKPLGFSARSIGMGSPRK